MILHLCENPRKGTIILPHIQFYKKLKGYVQRLSHYAPTPFSEKTDRKSIVLVIDVSALFANFANKTQRLYE